MKYVVAVSGGVDSVVLLDMLVKQNEHELVVAHFDHGIRPESDADARFVEAVAKTYGLAFETKREELGKTASEEVARDRRYAFLRSVAKKYDAVLATAHHQDDLIETIAINLQRGTGWRGLAVLATPGIERPMLGQTKREMYDYALRHGLEWVEDETNATDEYLRNRIRRKIYKLNTEARRELLKLWHLQTKAKDEIDTEANRILLDHSTHSRYFFTHIDEASALELLRTMLMVYGVSLTRPQRRRMLHAVKTMQPSAAFHAGAGVTIEFTKREFVVKLS